MALFAAGITVLSVESSDHGEIEAAMMVLQGGSLVAWGIMVDLLWRGRPCRLRRMFGIGADMLCVTLLLCVGGPPTQVWMFAYIWIGLGSALSDGRTGAKYPLRRGPSPPRRVRRPPAPRPKRRSCLLALPAACCARPRRGDG